MTVKEIRRSIGLRLRRAVPEQLRPTLRRGLDAVDPVRVLRHRRRTGETAPIPPRRLRARIGEPDIERFLRDGRAVANVLSAAAAQTGSPLESARRVLDFGCGCGRILQPLLQARGTLDGLAGCDVDRQAVSWLADHTSGLVDCRVNDFLPPLPFEAGHFNVVYTVSILTHLDEPTQDAWLAELHRVLVPGGVALVSVHGGYPYDVFRRGRQSGTSQGLLRRLRTHGPLTQEGFVFEPYDSAHGRQEELPGISGAYGLAFQTRQRVLERWSDRFSVEAHLDRALSGWQDLVVLRARDATTAPRLGSVSAQ